MNSVLNRTVSAFATCRATEPKPVNLLTWLQTDKYRQQVEAVRQATTKEERTALKQTLPAVTVSGTFNQRNQAGLVKHSGLLCLDIDSQDNQHITNFGDLKKELANIENFAYIGLSVSGCGYYCIVPISQPERHKEQFQSISNDLRQYGINVDQSGSDVTRLRFASYDPDAYFNHNAIVYKKLKMQRMQPVQRMQPCNNIFETLVSLISASGTDITGTYKAWFEIGCAIAHEFGEPGRQYFHELSQWHPKYKQAETDRQYSYCLRQNGSFSLNTVFYYADLQGINIKKNLQLSETTRGF